MNRHCYRLVFNKVKGRLVVASEAASSECRDMVVTPRCPIPPQSASRCAILGSLRPLAWSVMLALGLVAVPVHAQIAPDRSAPGSQRPHVVNSANGTPQVNITSPNGKGMSRNTYRQFDVDAKGTILNNSRTVAPTQIGGWVQGNPNLANGEARVIVNEINSSNPSRLHGAVEVAGRRAEVIIANPAGIDVDGADFINAQGITLTTGQPQFNSGALGGYRVEGGTVRIHGDGFDAGDADYAAILARAAEVQAGVWAEELDVVTGANRISADRQTINTIDGQGKSPGVGIDVAQLGGMYAGKIHLMATERGVGVNHAGDMAAGEIVVDADGRITNRGQIAAQGDMHLASRDDIANYGSLRAGDQLVVTSDGDLSNRDSGTMIARNDIQLSAADLTNDSDSLLAAGVSDDGALSATGDLTMSASQGIEGSGRHIAAGGFYAQAETVALRDSHTQAREIDIVAGQAGINASGATLSAQEALSTRTSGTLRADGSSVVADTLSLDVGRLSNIGGDIAQLGEQSLALRLDAFDNTLGRLASNSGLGISAHALDNTAGALQAVDDISVNAASLNNRDGDIVAGEALAIETSGDIDNTQGQWRASRIDVAASGLDNTTGLISATSDKLHVRADWFDNTQGRLETAGDLSLDIAHKLTNEAGEIVHAGEGKAQIDATHIDGRDGLVASQGHLVLRGEDIALDGATTSAELLTLNGDNLSHRQGEMQQFGDADDLSLNVGQVLDNTQGLIASNAGLDIAAHTLNSTAGTLQAVDDINVNAGSLNSRNGDIVAGGALAVETSGDIDNTQGQWQASRIDVAAAGLNNTAGLVSANGGELYAQLGMLDNTQGRLEAAGDLTLAIDNTLTNETGEIVHAGEGKAQIDATHIDGTDGLIAGQGELTLDAKDIVLDGATTSAESLALHADNLSHRQGEMQQFGDANDLTLNVGQVLDNTGGLIAGNADLDIIAQELINTTGTLQAVDGISVNAGSLNSRDGDIVAGDKLSIEVADDIDNTQGQWQASRIDVAADGLNNTAGLVSANGGELYAQLDEFDNTLGRLETASDLSLNIVGTLINEDGEIVHAGDGAARIDATGVDGSDGLIVSQGDLALDAKDIVLDGATTSAESLALHADNLSHRQGEMQQFGDANDLTLNVGQVLDNTGGLIAGNAGLDIIAQELINTAGTLQAVDDISVNATNLNNRNGGVVASEALAIEASGDIDNTQGQWRATSIDVAASGLDNTAGLISANGGELYAQLGEFDNTQGRMETAGDLSLDITGTVVNQDGEIIHAGEGVAQIGASHIEGSDGLIASQGELTLDAKDVVLDGATTSAESLTLHADKLSHRQGEMQQLGDAEDLTLSIGQALDNSGGLIAGNAGLDITAGGINNQDGTLQAIDEMRLNTGDMDNRRGEFVTGGQLSVIASGSIDNRDGGLIGEQGIALRAVSLDNRSGMLGALQGQLAVEAGTLDNTHGRIETAGDLSLDIAGLTNQDGEIVHAGDGEARIDTESTDGSDGLIASQGELTLTGDSINLDGAITSAERISIQAERLSHRQGEMSQHGVDAELLLDIREELNNSEGLMVSHGDLAIDAGDLVNRSGVLQAADALSIESGELNNRQGEILAGGSLGLDANGRLDNTGGRVVASRDATLSASSLVNAEGTLATQEGDLVLDIVGAINNRQGRLDAGGELTSASRAIDNRGGEIVATRGDIDTKDGSLNNRGGLIAAREALELASGAFDNAGGTLQAGGDLSLDTHGQALRNTGNGTVLGEGDVSLTVGSLDNTSGMIGVGTSLDLQADTIINRNGGALLSEAGMKTTAASLDNDGGQLQAQGDMSLDLDGRLGNRNGLIRAGQTLELSANQVFNRHTQGDDQGIEGHTIQLDADELDNREGTIRADRLADLQVEAGVNNRNGLISSLDTLTIKARDLDNRNGTLIADRSLDLTTARLADDGRVLSLGDLALRLASDFTLAEDGELMAAGDLQLAITGSINNRGKLRAGDTLSIEATRLNNAVSGELSGSTTDIDTAHLTNRGLIDGVETHIAADVLDNLGTGRIYGDWLGIEAGTLTNDNEDGQAAVMAARERLDLGVDRLINRDDALIFSAGDMAIGGHLDTNSGVTGRATRLGIITAPRLRRWGIYLYQQQASIILMSTLKLRQ